MPNTVIHTSSNSVENIQDLINETIESKFESFKASLMLSNLNMNNTVSDQSNLTNTNSNNNDLNNNNINVNKTWCYEGSIKRAPPNWIVPL